jgi:pimeloyl-ACP methyl ester carboxylesterase
MKVSPALIEASMNDPVKAMTMVNVFSRSTLAAPPSAMGAGTWVYGTGMALGRRVLASNTAVNVFHRGFVACDSYARGEAAMAEVACPVLFLLGAVDQMTTPKAAQGLIQLAQAAGKQHRVMKIPVGHNQMTEAPEATLFALRDFLAERS